MRFVRLHVEAFRAIERAEVDFGPGLNVLYGPNDLGKSTLAAAIRAALLVPPSSSEAAQFVPWCADATPRVSLTFVDAADRYWTVRKTFGERGGTAELLHSKDGRSFSLDCKGRQVEERLRGLLEWGIPAPGGKGGPRGVPTTFLANALLAAQTDVDAILGASLAADPDPAGRIRLSKALATLAQDPLFKTVLDAAQREVDQSFTRSGQRSRARSSRFSETAAQIKELQKEHEDLERVASDSAAIEARVTELRQRRDTALVRVEEAAARLSSTRDQVTQAHARQNATERLEAARAALAAIDEQAARVRALDADLATWAAEVRAREGDAAGAIARAERARIALQGAEEALRAAASEDGVRQRELLRAQLSEKAASLSVLRQAAEGRGAAVRAALQAEADAAAVEKAAAGARLELERLQGDLGACREAAIQAESESELARATVAYGRWRAAQSAAHDAIQAQEAEGACARDADRKSAEAASLEEKVSQVDAGLSARQRLLPTPDVLRALGQVERELEVAEAALGGGVSVVLRPRQAVDVQAEVDGKEVAWRALPQVERVLEGDRSVRLSIAEILEVEVVAGAPEQRRTLDKLRARRKKDVLPALKRAGLNTLGEVASALGEIERDRAALQALRAQAAQLRVEVQTLRERARAHAEQASRLAENAAGLEERHAALGPSPVTVLEKRFAALGRAWELPAEAAYAKASTDLKARQKRVSDGAQAVKVAEYRLLDGAERASAASKAADGARARVGSADLASVLAAVEEELASVAAREKDTAARLKALTSGSAAEIEVAKRAVQTAKEAAAAEREHVATAASALDHARAELHARTGEANILRAQLAALDRAGARALVETYARELAGLPAGPRVTDVDVALAEENWLKATREVEQAKEDLHKSEGALSQVGGAAVRDEVESVEQALAAARARERELDTDAHAWQLLRNTLRDVENEEGAHLGRALAGPVMTKFVELTAGRYKDLRLDAALKTESVGLAALAAGPDVLSALSVGTRNQLATLIRLTIAVQLESAIVLDDHLVHTDATRLAWFGDLLKKTGLSAQVIVLTCRPEDYLGSEDLPSGTAVRDLAGGSIRAVDVARVVRRWEGVASPPAAT